jgi:pSer/pThr/pTyr-binding forkhead associated (FHA) protein
VTDPAEQRSTGFTRLRCRGRDLFLPPGEYILGRGKSCDVFIDSNRASRRHARIVVRDSSLTIEDLSSANGVLLNGGRLAAEPKSLQSGDRVTIGDVLVEVVDVRQARTDGSDPSGANKLGPRSPSSDSRVTQRDDGFEFAGAVARRAIASGQVQSALDVLGYPLARIRQDTKAGSRVPEHVRAAAIDYACALAKASGEGKWIDYVYDLLAASAEPYSTTLANAIEAALRAARDADPAAIEQYVRKLRALPVSWENLRALQHAEAMQRLAREKRVA